MATKISQLPQMSSPEDVMQVPYITTGTPSSVETKRMAGSLLKTSVVTAMGSFVYDGGNATSTFLDPATLTEVGGAGATV
tara:strand:+ start:380 stop:619 length:240 start_codon:yes stop_codon:yes gene_type:complete